MTLFTIAPVGTCRIHTPLRRGAGHYPIRPVLARNYGFVHTSSEALQQLQFMFGKKDIPADVRTLTFRPGSSGNFEKKSRPGADLYLVEISSRKLLSVDDHPIQMNYMVRHFGDFFADKKRSRLFWSMATPNRMAERRQWLEQDFAFQRLSPVDRDLLARIQRRDLKDAEISAEMEQIAEIVGRDHLAFVTHVNADTPDNMPVEQRRELINTVRAIAKRLDLPCYDPTPLMRKLGQANAMENGGLDLTHYTDLFSDQLCEAWYTEFVVPKVDASEIQAAPKTDSVQHEDTAESLEAAWNAGRVLEVSKRLRAMLRHGEGSRQHRLLMGRVHYELGDFEGAAAQFESFGAEPEFDEKTNLLLTQCYFETGRYEQAGRLAAALIADEREAPAILRICAESAGKLGDTATALATWKRLFRVSTDTADASVAATAVIHLLDTSGDAEGAIQWAHEVREALPTHAPSFLALWDRALAASDREALLELAREPVDMGEAEILALAQRTAEHGFATPAALLAATQGLTRSSGKEATEWIARSAEAWLDEGNAALASGDMLPAADKIQARAQLNSNGNALIRAKRQLERQMRQDVRAALIAREYERAAGVLAIASQTLTTFPELASFRIRVAEALDDIRTALVYLRDASALDDIAESTWIKLARMAVRSGYYGEAIDAYARVLNSPSSDPAARIEAKRQILGLRSRVIRLARDAHRAGDYERAWALLERLQQLDPDNKEVSQERKRVLAGLHVKVKSLDAASDMDRLSLGETILRLAPEDPIGLKAAATGAMRTHRFDQALKYWQALRTRSASPELIDGNIQKCRIFIDRAKRKKAA
jgi:tetratricopeptide (TPR) repeat protein